MASKRMMNVLTSTLVYFLSIVVVFVNADCLTGSFTDGSIIDEIRSPNLDLTKQALDVVSAAGLPDPAVISTGDTFFAPTNRAWTSAAAYLDTTVEGLFGEPEVVNDLLKLSIGTVLVTTDQLKSGDLIPTEYGESLKVRVSFYTNNIKAVFISPSSSSAATCIPDAKLVDINFPVCGGTIEVQVISAVLIPTSCDIFPLIEEIALDTPELSLLSEAFGILDGAGIPLVGETQLAPTNLAWQRSFVLLGTTKEELFANVDKLSDIVAYNRIDSGELKTCTIADGQTVSTAAVGSFKPDSDFDIIADYDLMISIRSVLERLCGGQLQNLYIFRRIIIMGKVNSSRVLVPDIQGCDGTVWITDSVLLPPTLFFTLTLMDLICSASVLSTLCSLIRDTPVDAILAALSDPSAKFVVFAPTNFAISSALAYLRIDPASVDAGTLAFLIGYHAVSLPLFSTEAVFTFQWRNQQNSYTNLEGKTLSIIVNGEFPLEGFFINGGCNTAQVIVPLSNRVAVNGVLHVVDRLILPVNSSTFCPTLCARLELNPLTTVFVAAIYALGLANEYCAVGITGGVAPRLGSGTVFAPTDLAFAKLFLEGGVNILTLFQNLPEKLYDIILYHTIVGTTIFTQDIVDGASLGDTALNTGFGPTGAIDTSTFLTGRRFDSFTLIRRNLLRTALFVEGQRCGTGMDATPGTDCPGRIIVPNQETVFGGIVQTIDQVLLPPEPLICKTPTVESTDSIAIAATVQYIGPVGCSLFCIGITATCFPCSPFVAQEIWTSESPGSAALSDYDDIVYTLYVNQIGEVRFGQVPGFIKSKWTNDHAIGPIGIFKSGASIVAQGFIAVHLAVFNVIANAIALGSGETLIKIYINGLLKGAGVVEFVSVISLSEIQYQLNQLIQTYVIEAPFLNIPAANYPGALIHPRLRGLHVGEDMSYATVVDASSMDDPESIVSFSSANATLSALSAAVADGEAAASTVFYSLSQGVPAVDALMELFDGIDGVGYYNINGFPDVLSTTEFYANCGPIFDQYAISGPGGVLNGYPPCGISAVYYQRWRGVIFRLSVFGGVEIFPSTCEGQPFGVPNF